MKKLEEVTPPQKSRDEVLKERHSGLLAKLEKALVNKTKNKKE